MKEDCFAYECEEKESDGIKWKKERCFCTISKTCDGCTFYKNRDSVSKRIYYIFQTKIVEWLPK